ATPADRAPRSAPRLRRPASPGLAATHESPMFRALAAAAIRDLALRLAIPLFVGRSDPGMAAPPVELPAVIGR
ncbi:MAG: hypothetical protein ACRDE9_00490, partial [Candidatus Limnocylindria bacterium]